MKSAFVLATAIAAICAATAMADGLDEQLEAALKAASTQASVQKKEAAVKVAEFQHPRAPQRREPAPKAPQREEPRRGRWERQDGWRPVHFAKYLGYSFDMAECQAFGRAEGFPFVTRYNLSGDCYGDYRPY